MPLESVLIGAAGNVIGGSLLEWLQNRGPEFTEADWMEMGIIAGRELRAAHEQNEIGTARKNKEVQNLATDAGRIFRELSYIGERRGFNQDVVESQKRMADSCAKWGPCLVTAEKTIYNENANLFLEEFENYRGLTAN